MEMLRPGLSGSFIFCPSLYTDDRSLNVRIKADEAQDSSQKHWPACRYQLRYLEHKLVTHLGINIKLMTSQETINDQHKTMHRAGIGIIISFDLASLIF